MTWVAAELTIQGVKGVLDRAGDFRLAKKRSPRSMALYAPNACGKSGYADAVEYLFSEDGCVDHLGKGGPDSECGGKHAIPHVLAEERGIEPMVSLKLVNSDTGESIQVSRSVTTGRVDAIPPELRRIVSAAPAHRILRQHDLRRFVVDMTPGQKYAELSRWLGLKRLEEVLGHLVTTSNALESTDLDREIGERVQDIVQHTGGAVTGHDTNAVLRWCAAETKRHLGKTPVIESPEDVDTAISALRRRREQIILSSSAAGSYQAKQTLQQTATNMLAARGAFELCDSALSNAAKAEKAVQRARSAAKESVFQEVWDATKGVLESQVTAECPICLTPWGETQLGSQNAALLQVRKSLKGLSQLAAAQAKQRSTAQQLRSVLTALARELTNVQTEASKISLTEVGKHALEFSDAAATLAATSHQPSRIQSRYAAFSARCRAFVSQSLLPTLQSLKISGVPMAAVEIAGSMEHLQTLRSALTRLARLSRERDEYRKVERSFNLIADVIRMRTASHVNDIVEALRDDMLSVFLTIHPTGAVPNIHITPDTTSRTLRLRVDFHSPDRTVPPSGYLSESQINTLGLALFISSIGLFNREFPFLFLDDIVSSYDADHRGRIVDLVAERLDEFQVFLTTHDWRFYSMLRSRLSDKGWLFERVMGWDFEHGPKREVDALRPHHIEALIQDGDPTIAGNAVRQYMEEWLDAMCAKYEAYTIHKRGPKEFDRTLFDFWGPFMARLNRLKGSFFSERIEPQSCYQRLKAHSLLNYYSHAQANPYEWPAIGDVEYVWVEFQEFVSLFQCASCGRTLRYDRDLSRLYCVCGGQVFSLGT